MTGTAVGALGRTLATIAVLASMLTIAACGAGGSGGGAAPEASSEADADAFPVSIEHKHGTTEISEPPERVVSAGYTELDTMLALGVTPVGTREFLGGYEWRERPWAQDVGGEEPEVIGAEQLNFERVASVAPDVIIGLNSGMAKREYDTLAEIAPTVPQSDEFIDFGVPWQEQTRATGEALGREEQAQELIAEVEEEFAAALEANPEFEGKTAVLGYGERASGSFGAYASGDFRVRFFEDLGFENPPEIDELAGEEFFVDFSEEQIELLDQDVVVMFADREEVLENPLYRRLDAVREERVIYLDLSDQLAGALGYSSPLSLPYAIEGLGPRLAAAIDGDPATEIEETR